MWCTQTLALAQRRPQRFASGDESDAQVEATLSMGSNDSDAALTIYRLRLREVVAPGVPAGRVSRPTASCRCRCATAPRTQPAPARAHAARDRHRARRQPAHRGARPRRLSHESHATRAIQRAQPARLSSLNSSRERSTGARKRRRRRVHPANNGPDVEAISRIASRSLIRSAITPRFRRPRASGGRVVVVCASGTEPPRVVSRRSSTRGLRACDRRRVAPSLLSLWVVAVTSKHSDRRRTAATSPPGAKHGWGHVNGALSRLGLRVLRSVCWFAAVSAVTGPNPLAQAPAGQRSASR